MVRKKAATKSSKAMTNYEERFAQEAELQYDREPTGGGNFINIKGNEFNFQGEALGGVMSIVIVADCFENAFYDSAYNADDPLPPGCFSIEVSPDDLSPNEEGPNIQSDGDCSDCWANEFGSSETGRGKACKNSRRLAIMAVSIDEDGNLEAVSTGEVAVLRVPPTSLKNYSGFIKRSNKVLRRPSWAYVTEVSFDENADYETLTFKLIGPIEDSAILQAIDEQRSIAVDEITQPFDSSNYKDPETVKAERRRAPRKKVAKKKVAKKKVTKKKVTTKRRSKMS